MKREALVEYEDASPEVQLVYDEIMEVSGTPDIWNILKAFGHNEVALRGMWGLLRYVVLEGDIPALLKQLILFKISVEYGNEYCTTLHGQILLRRDRSLSRGELLTMVNDAPVSLPASYAVAIDVVTRLALQPQSAAAAEFDFEEQLRDEGFSEREIEELIAIAGFGALINTMSNIVALVPDEFLSDITM